MLIPADIAPYLYCAGFAAGYFILEIVAWVRRQ
jgi:hypothetical protein